MKFHIYKAKDGWRWRLKARNGKIVADSGEAYTRKTAAERGALRLMRQVIFAGIALARGGTQ